MVLCDYRSLSKYAAIFVSETIRANPTAVLGLATGATQLGLYRELVEMARRGLLDLSRITTFNLDEYYRIKKKDPRSYYHYMQQNFWGPAAIEPSRAHIPDGDSDDVTAECHCYEQKIKRAGGIDLQILGIGVNGHIGFNEPGASLQAGTHLVQLSEETVIINSRFFGRATSVPRMALTMGMGTIMKSRRILLLAAGQAKATAIKETVKGPLSTLVPASLLQIHPRVTVMVDREAGRQLFCQNKFEPMGEAGGRVKEQTKP